MVATPDARAASAHAAAVRPAHAPGAQEGARHMLRSTKKEEKAQRRMPADRHAACAAMEAREGLLRRSRHGGRRCARQAGARWAGTDARGRQAARCGSRGRSGCRPERGQQRRAEQRMVQQRAVAAGMSGEQRLQHAGRMGMRRGAGRIRAHPVACAVRVPRGLHRACKLPVRRRPMHQLVHAAQCRRQHHGQRQNPSHPQRERAWTCLPRTGRAIGARGAAGGSGSPGHFTGSALTMR